MFAADASQLQLFFQFKLTLLKILVTTKKIIHVNNESYNNNI